MKKAIILSAVAAFSLSACSVGGSVGTGGVGASVGATLDNIGLAISNTFGEKQTVKVEKAEEVKTTVGNTATTAKETVIVKAQSPKPLSEKEYAQIKARTEKEAVKTTGAVQQVKQSATNVANNVLTKGENVTQAVVKETKAVASKAIDKGVSKITAPLNK